MDLVIAAVGWLILALLAVVVVACAGRAGRDADRRLGYDGYARCTTPAGAIEPPREERLRVGHGRPDRRRSSSADRRTGRLERL